ncbi:MAG TPA: response regulator transcription factor [Phycisphaerales bacterium]|nr:response regulator transcription factor [Phycisphaerales bacterium]
MKSHRPAPLRIMCVDDNDLLATAMERYLRNDPDFVWLGWESDPAQVTARVGAVKPDVVLMDIDIPGADTFALVEAICAEHPQTKVVMFSGHVNGTYLDRAMDCGAWGYLCKDEEPAALLDGIRQVARGELAFGKEVLAVQRSRDR